MFQSPNVSTRRRQPYQDVNFPATVIAAHSYAEIFGFCPNIISTETRWHAIAIPLYSAGGNEPLTNWRVILHDAAGPGGSTVQYRLIQQNVSAAQLNPSTAATVRIYYFRI